jgi:tripartite-type tricarboxylate transporter receptor subunit TctC
MIRAAALAAALAVAAPMAVAQSYPTRPITIVVPFAPGGIADITARPLAVALGSLLNQSLIIENHPGAGGAVGIAYAGRQKPDGYTLLMALSSILVIPEAEKVGGRPSSYQMSQFTPIALISADPVVLIVPTQSAWKTTADLIADARSRPGKISYSSSGLYGAIHVPMEMLAQAAGVQFLHVPYQSGGQAMNALLAGQVDVSVQSPGVASPHLKSGRVKALANWGAQRLKALPEVATLKEQGYDAEFYIWSGLFAQSGTPPEVLARLRGALKEAVSQPVFRQAMASMDSPVEYLDAPEFQRFMDRDGARLVEAVRRMGKIE